MTAALGRWQIAGGYTGSSKGPEVPAQGADASQPGAEPKIQGPGPRIALSRFDRLQGNPRSIQASPDPSANRPLDPWAPELASFLSAGLPMPAWRLGGGGTIPIDRRALMEVCRELEVARNSKPRRPAVRNCRVQLTEVLVAGPSTSMPTGVSLPRLPRLKDVLAVATRPLRVSIDALDKDGLRELQRVVEQTDSTLTPEVSESLLRYVLAPEDDEVVQMDLARLRAMGDRPAIPLRIDPRTPTARRQLALVLASVAGDAAGLMLLSPESTQYDPPQITIYPQVAIEAVRVLLDALADHGVVVEISLIGAFPAGLHQQLTELVDEHGAVANASGSRAIRLPSPDSEGSESRAEAVDLLVEWLLICAELAPHPAGEWPAKKQLRNRLYQQRHYKKKRNSLR